MNTKPITREDLLKEIDTLEAAKYELEGSYYLWKANHNLLYNLLEAIAMARATSSSWEEELALQLEKFEAYKQGKLIPPKL